MSNPNFPKIMVRLPKDVKNFLMEQATENASSQSSEIVRAVRERMQRQRAAPPEELRSSPKIEG